MVLCSLLVLASCKQNNGTIQSQPSMKDIQVTSTLLIGGNHPNKFIEDIYITSDGTTLMGQTDDTITELFPNFDIIDIEAASILKNIEYQNYYGSGFYCSHFALSPDGTVLATAIQRDGAGKDLIKLWDLTSGELLQEYETLPITYTRKCIRGFVSDSILAIEHSTEDPELYYFDLTEGKVTQTLNYKNVLINPKNNTFVPFDYTKPNQPLNLIDATSGNVVLSFQNRPKYTDTDLTTFTNNNQIVTFIDDGKKLFNGGYGWVTIWDVTTGEVLNQFKFEEKIDFQTATFSPDGSIMLSNSDGIEAQKLGKLWSTTDGKLLHELEGLRYGVSAVFTPDGTKLIVASGHVDYQNTITIYSTADNDPIFINHGTN